MTDIGSLGGEWLLCAIFSFLIMPTLNTLASGWLLFYLDQILVLHINHDSFIFLQLVSCHHMIF